ncbi:hypothetical protein PPACK8108_LOCUS16568 [Phakopsora pachyrhizi]|uniref:Secreted protein n=1 Tax=Phakopsora pachyrhizi TaxID=170000 RepID=A0AAV0BD86_PHAPC|nr:hypothetical protein PPACK8108_LOCUS16568 [Phakopsora pachyrhizi]
MLSHLQNPHLSLLLLLFLLIPLPILPHQSHFWYFNVSSRLNLLFSHFSSATMDLTQLLTPIKLTSSFLMQLLTWLPDWTLPHWLPGYLYNHQHLSFNLSLKL